MFAGHAHTGEIYSPENIPIMLKNTEMFIDFPLFSVGRIPIGRGSASFSPAEGPRPASSHPALPLPGGADGGDPTSENHGKPAISSGEKCQKCQKLGKIMGQPYRFRWIGVLGTFYETSTMDLVDLAWLH